LLNFNANVLSIVLLPILNFPGQRTDKTPGLKHHQSLIDFSIIGNSLHSNY